MGEKKKKEGCYFKLKDNKLVLVNSYFPFTASAKIEIEPGSSFTSGIFSKWQRSDRCYLSRSELSLELSLKIDGNKVGLGIKNCGEKPLYIKSARIVFSPAEISPPLVAGDYIQLVHSRATGTSDVRPVGRRTLWSDGTEPSYLVTVFHNKNNGRAFLMGSLPDSPGYTYFEALHSSPTREENFGFSIGWELEVEIKPGFQITTAPVVVLTGPSGVDLLTQYGEICHQQIKNRILPPKTGWNSWDYYSSAVRQEDMRENTLAIKNIFGTKLQYIVIDEGWQCKWGVWQPNWKFSDGLKKFCDDTYKEGYIPGIWTAPFMVDYGIPFYREHPELFASDSNGEVVLIPYSYGTVAVLDITQPAATEFLESAFHQLRSYGFRYFKIDFLESLLRASRFFDRSVARAQLIRQGVSVIRRAIGEDSYLLACTAPVESVIGLVDSFRVTGDIHTFWSHVKTNARALSARFWMNGKLWRNDPDFLVIRTHQTSDDRWLNRRNVRRPPEDYWMAGKELTITEAKTYALLVFLSGGDIILGDAITKLNSEGLKILKRALENPLSNSAIPVDLFNQEGRIPSIYLLKEKDSAYLGLFNWNDYTQKFSLDFKELGLSSYTKITEFWSGKRVSLRQLNNIELKPRDSVCFIFQKK